MKFLFLTSIFFFYACGNKRETGLDKRQVIRDEMKYVNAFYYKNLDSLEILKNADTNTLKLYEIAEEIQSTDKERSNKLLKLQNEYDSLNCKDV